MTKPNLLDPEIQQCPFSFYEQLREAAPVSYMPELNAYYVASYDLARTVLIDAKRFAKRSAEGDGRKYITPNPKAQELLQTKGVGLPLSMMSLRDGADHRALRGLVDKFFKPRAVVQMEAYVEETVADLLDRLKGRSEIEVVGDFAVPLPLYIIADLMGVPKSDYLDFKRWSDGVVTYMAMSVPEPQAIAGAEAMIEMHRYTLAEVAKRRAEPKDDLMNSLATAEYQGRPLTDREICGFMDELLAAGNETTTSALSAGLLMLARDQALQARLRADPELIGKFVDELLRLESPLQITLRFSIEDVELGGVLIPGGSNIFVSLGSANRDGCAFADPEQMDLARPGDRTSFTFGAGAHHCLGAELSRLEQKIAFRQWLERYSRIELADPDVSYPASYAIRGPKSVKLRVEPA